MKKTVNRNMRAGEKKRPAGERRLTPKQIKKFQKTIYAYYCKHEREFPWRSTRNPYHILVSEIMLQQTQTERVLRKYETFLKEFPTFQALAEAPLRSVLATWQGLGYNRRAVSLKRAAEIVVNDSGDALPKDPETLITLPGVGKATAGAIAAFAFDQPVVFIETNIRRVFLHLFFPEEDGIKDSQILPLVESTLDHSNPREWYYALMDYGVMLKAAGPNPNVRSAHYKKQSPFEGSDRQIRGMILRILVANPNIPQRDILKKIDASSERVTRILNGLEKEGFIKKKRTKYSIV